MADYHYVSTWQLQAPIEQVWPAISDLDTSAFWRSQGGIPAARASAQASEDAATAKRAAGVPWAVDGACPGWG
jgi:hypothetical protein